MFQAIEHVLQELVQIERTGVGQVSLGLGPNSFIRVQLRRIGGKVLQVQPGMTTLGLQLFSPMHGGVVEQDQQRTAQMPQQVTEKLAYLVLSNTVQKKLVIQPESLPSRAHRNGRDGGDLLPMALTMTMNRSATLGSPGFAQVRNQQKAGFVGKY